MVKKWFHPTRDTGWDKDQSPSTRRAKLMESGDKRMKLHDRYLEAGWRAQALANVTQDKETERKARADAKYFFAKLK